MSKPEESSQERLARNLNELLQELRVSQAGVQILFGFLLAIAFSDRYHEVDQIVRIIHVFTVLFAAASVALLTAPAAWHRLLFRRGQREWIVEQASRVAIAGLVCLSLAMIGAVFLLSEVIIGGWLALILGLVALTGFAFLWFLFPFSRR